ncbi:hypothetical protein B0A49_03405 [Cryomyces minteri]|uniref:DUF4336 domain-containing protein n=1 Tax=Cryomyces minteri TaxID=331657 RepID=A0A4U0XUP4_9PEZI|nr:hypothetical protein B0A49_03405 [Cryomyces minteri]
MLVRLSTGFLAVFSPPPLTAGVREVIETFGNGEVAYLICPNAEHYIFLHDWYSVFPKATVVTPQTLVTKFASGQASVPHVPITLAFPCQQHSPDMKQFEHEFEPAFFGANANEIVLLHKASRTLLTADMVFNPPATESYTKSDDSATKGLLTYLFNWSKGTSGFPLTMQHRIFNIIAGKGNDRKGSPLLEHDAVKAFMVNFGGHEDLVSSDGHTRKTWRSVFNPGFPLAHLMTLVPHIVDNAPNFCDTLSRHVDEGHVFRLEEAAARLTVDIIGKGRIARFSKIPERARGGVQKMGSFVGRVLDERLSSREVPKEMKGKHIIDLALETCHGDQQQDNFVESMKPRTMNANIKRHTIYHTETFIFAGRDTMSSIIC